MSIDPIDLLVIIGLGLIGIFSLKALFRPDRHELKYEEDEMPDRDLCFAIENAEPDRALAAKVKCLEWAIGMCNDDADKAVKDAQKFWAFMSLEPEDK